MSDINDCKHYNIAEENGYNVCRECGLAFEGNLVFEKFTSPKSFFSDSQQNYERNINRLDSRARQDPSVASKFNKIKTLETWFRDCQTSFTKQKKIISLLGNYGFSVDSTQFEHIKKEYLRYIKKKKDYENMVINFLAIIWIEIKETTNKRLEDYIEACDELGHKISKRMMSKAIERVITDRQKKIMSIDEIERTIKDRIKVLLEKDLNNIPFEEYPDVVNGKEDFEQLKMFIMRLANKLLEKLEYNDLRNLNYKAFTSGFVYFLGQCLNKQRRRLFVQTIIEQATNFSTTTIRKKYNSLKNILGVPEIYRTH